MDILIQDDVVLVVCGERFIPVGVRICGVYNIHSTWELENFEEFIDDNTLIEIRCQAKKGT